MEVMEEEAQELLSYFNHRNVDALLRLTRNTLEMLRKRIHASSLIHFLGGSCVTILLVLVLWLIKTFLKGLEKFHLKFVSILGWHKCIK